MASVSSVASQIYSYKVGPACSDRPCSPAALEAPRGRWERWAYSWAGLSKPDRSRPGYDTLETAAARAAMPGDQCLGFR